MCDHSLERPKKTLEAATAMKLSSKDLKELNIIDEIIPEPTGGAHRNKEEILNNIRSSLSLNLEKLSELSRDEIYTQRKNKFLSIGRDKDISPTLNLKDSLVGETNDLDKIISFIFKYKIFFILSLIILISAILILSL